MPKATHRLRSACALLLTLLVGISAITQEAHTPNAPPPPGAKTTVCKNRPIPQLVDITKKAGITFEHVAAREKKYIVESMAGGVVIIDYDRDGWPDIYFTNTPTVSQALAGVKARGALYH